MGEHKDCGTVTLQPPDAEAKYLVVGFEHGCTCPATHLGLRFHDQPASGVDGTAFPRQRWEASPYFTPDGFPIEVAGRRDDARRAELLAVYGGPRCLSEPRDPWMAPEIDPWRDFLREAPRVVAEWFVLHDTGGGRCPTRPPTGEDRGVHLFVGPDGVFLNQEYTTAGSATRFEWAKYHPEFRGKMIHCELENRSQAPGTPTADPYTDFQYQMAALAYVFASYRAEAWLTVTAHIAVDLGIPGGHSDPRGFDYPKLYRIVSALVGMPAGSTYGLLADPTGKNANDADYINTFPAQYEPARRSKQLKKK